MTKEDLKVMQGWSFERKIQVSQTRIMEWYMHYEGKVGLVPLSLSAHELVHEGELFIPLTSEYVFGNWEEGTEQLLLNDDAKSHLDLLKKLTKKYIDSGKTLDLSILDDIQLRVQMKNELRPKIIHQEKDDDQHNIA